MKFFCINENAKYAADQIWAGDVEIIRQKGTFLEAKIQGKGSAIYVIIGEYQYGRYLCIPGMGIGSELSTLGDRFWNREQLERKLSMVDAITVSQALKAIADDRNLQMDIIVYDIR